ncbi:hypothetical protein B1s21122_05885 [Candidatus Nanopelagicus limnes]|uniref:Uncharacterized protein n=1 Tax=Candidatus Nanopelagicus limnae TaxID=1884634 RepID=A0A249JZA4_9ACTN|nr:hypothetical protein [Candidatus Nanopelagicus limnes]ASY09839.1 hypothetical protein B1s21122_05885 [Candidatus Nanopelagicus limnes]
MSTKTNFKRIALVAVAALGMGVLSSVPSQAAVSAVTITAVNGTSTIQTGTTGGTSDTRTAATVDVVALVGAGDSVTVSAVAKSIPTGATRVALLGIVETNTASGYARTDIDDTTKMGTSLTLAGASYATDSETIASAVYTMAGGAAGYIGTKFFLQLESGTGTTIAGTYTYTVTVQSISYLAATATYAVSTQTTDVSIVVAALAAASKVASAVNSRVYINDTAATEEDESLSSVATASNTAVGYLYVYLKNASAGGAARESVTVTTNIGQVGDGASNRGRSVVLKYNNDSGESYPIYADGTTGVATFTISTPSVAFGTKTMSFYAVAAKTMTATVATPLLKVGTNSDAVRVTAVDASGIAWSGAAYIYASSAADALIAGSVTPSLCTWDADDARHECTISGVSAGTAKFKIIDAATVALATATSNEVSVVVNANAASTVKLSFDKASYAPNERARIYVTPLDSAGKEIASSTWANLFAAGGISVNGAVTYPAGQPVDSLTAVSVTTAGNASSTTGAKAGSLVYTVFMPAAGGSVTISATGGTSLPLAGQVAVTATATVTDSGAAALAAVTALATTVASLKTLITTLTNLVLKIQKKVKA